MSPVGEQRCVKTPSDNHGAPPAPVMSSPFTPPPQHDCLVYACGALWSTTSNKSPDGDTRRRRERSSTHKNSDTQVTHFMFSGRVGTRRHFIWTWNLRSIRGVGRGGGGRRCRPLLSAEVTTCQPIGVSRRCPLYSSPDSSLCFCSTNTVLEL